MLQFLLCLLYYEIDVYDHNSYFSPLTKLEYCFNENANYSVHFTNIKEKMIFGFATHDEISNIRKVENKQAYCEGQYVLSDIQFPISADQSIQGQIPYESILIPYCFVCSKSYSFTIGFDYLNGSNQLDYRCQQLLIFTFIFTIITFIYIILFTSFSCFSKTLCPKD